MQKTKPQIQIVVEEEEAYLDVGGKLLDYVDLLELIARMSYDFDKNSMNNLLTLIDLADFITPKNKNIPLLKNSVRELIFRNYKGSLPNEFDIQKMAKKRLPDLISGCKVINKKSNFKHVPDIWIDLNQKIVPVEVKLNDFNDKAKEQLIRYINFYDCDTGIAIGNKLTTNLPANINFISIKELEDIND